MKNQDWYNWLHNAQYCLAQSVCHGTKLHLTHYKCPPFFSIINQLTLHVCEIQFNVMVIYFHVFLCVSRHLMPRYYQHKHCIPFLFSLCYLILTLQRWSTILNNSLYAYICVFISTLFSDTLNLCSLVWYRDQYQVWSFPEEKFTLWCSELWHYADQHFGGACLSKTWIPMYQIHSVISQKTRIWICI